MLNWCCINIDIKVINNRVQNIFGMYLVSLKVLIWSLTFGFGYFQQDNYEIEFLVAKVGTRLQFELLIFFHWNSLIS